MVRYHCQAVPPYILQGLINDPKQHEHVREMAISTLAITKLCHHERHRASCADNPHDQEDSRDSQYAPHSQAIVPDYVLQYIADAEDVDDTTRSSAQDTLAASGQSRRTRATRTAADDSASKQFSAVPVQPPVFNQEVYDMHHNGVWAQLPGSVLRKEGSAAAVKDTAADEVYANTLVVLNFFWDVFGYASVDGRHAKVKSSVYFSDRYANAVWHVDKKLGLEQMVYGDGDGVTLGSFARALDVVGHEFMVSASLVRPLVAGRAW